MSTQHVTTIHTGRRRLKFQMNHRLALAMDEAGIPAEDMAALLKCSTGTISNYRRKATTPNHSTLVRWADICDVELDWLLYGDEVPGPDTTPDTGFDLPGDASRRKVPARPLRLLQTAA